MKTSSMIASGIAALVLLAAAPAFAEECSTDADCIDGFFCAKPGVACAVSPEGEEDCEDPADLLGSCARAPLSCEADADCPGILTCESAGSPTICLEDEDADDGDEGCGDPVAEEFFCDWRPAECDDETLCAEGFDCVAESLPGAPCEEICDDEGDCRTECPEEPNQNESAGRCFPQEIECETDDQCPTDWTCYTLQYDRCSSGGSTGSGGSPDSPPATEDEGQTDEDRGEGEGSDDDDERRIDPDDGDVECESVEESRCLPPGFDRLIEQDGGSFDGGGAGSLFENAEEDRNGSDDGSSDAGGCAVPTGRPTPMPLAFLALVGGLALLRRRS